MAPGFPTFQSVIAPLFHPVARRFPDGEISRPDAPKKVTSVPSPRYFVISPFLGRTCNVLVPLPRVLAHASRRPSGENVTWVTDTMYEVTISCSTAVTRKKTLETSRVSHKATSAPKVPAARRRLSGLKAIADTICLGPGIVLRSPVLGLYILIFVPHPEAIQFPSSVNAMHRT